MLKFLKYLFIIFILISIFWYYKYSSLENRFLNENKNIEVISWDTLTNVLVNDFWYNKIFLKIYFKINKDKSINIQAWNYSFTSWENIDGIIKTFTKWTKALEEKLTILEWWNIYDIDEYLTSLSLIEKWTFISKSKNIDEFKKEYSFLNGFISLEWFLYPDTYFVNKNTFILDDFINQMLKNFKQKVFVNLLYTLDENNLKEVMILSSIVEKEEKNDLERPTVAWILKKRLKNNWMIWADITACYAFEITSKECQKNLVKYIYEKNDYNTRAMTWLPKTPINNPSISSIEAVLNSNNNTPYWYYLHDNTWKIHYWKTNEEHIKNKNNYLK